MFADRQWHRRGWHKEPVEEPDTTAPTISGVTETELTSSSIRISWALDERATGEILYGPTLNYGNQTPTEENPLTYHSQTIPGTGGAPLDPQKLYYYRIQSRDPSGNGGSYEGTFTTAGTAPSPSALEHFGIDVQAVNKNNLQVKSPASGDTGHGQAVAYRFKATNTGAVKYLRYQWKNRSGSDYAGGDGGRYRVGITTLTGERMPNMSNWLDSVEWSPGMGSTSAGGYCTQRTLNQTANLVSGTEYAIVWYNIHNDPASNFSSTNNPAAHGHEQPYPPHARWPNRECHALGYGPNDWSEDVEGTEFYPGFDLEYADGAHDGFAWVMGVDYSPYGWLNESAWGDLRSGAICRFTFTYPSTQDDILVDACVWFMHKISGSGTNATLSVKKNGGEVATGTFTTSGVMGIGERSWCRAELSSAVTFTAGDDIEAIVTTAGSYWHLPAVQFQDNECSAAPNAMVSYPFTLSSTGRTQPFRSYDGTSGTTTLNAGSFDKVAYSCFFEVAG